MAVGQIQSDGSYELSTYSPDDGAALGKHQVFVQPPPGEEDELDPLGESRPAVFAIPRKYQSASTSGLVFEVKPGVTNEFPIDLKSN